MSKENPTKRKQSQKHKPLWIGGLIFAVLAILTAAILMSEPGTAPEVISFSEAAAAIADGRVARVIFNPSSASFTIQYTDGSEKASRREITDSLLEQLSLLGVSPEALANVQFEISDATAAASGTQSVLLVAMLVGIPLTAAVYLQKRERGAKKTYKEIEVPSLRFKDVAGLDENLQELQDIVHFLKDGNRYAEIGAQMPRGILMVGDPGTGKTLVAKAIAGEAGVPFFATSGSEFVEMYVGVGASRVRKLFEMARKKAPCIVFIDEIDAVGRARRRSDSGAEMEQDQTLNQLLVEMDGFARSEGIVVLAATNRLDVLDPALTRPGRFDRRIYIHRPDLKGRKDILGIHTRNKRLAPDVDLSNLAKSTPGLAGADLANIVNEAAIGAVRRKSKEIARQDFDEAVEKVLAGGVQRKGFVMSQEERSIVAYHEAGHAVVMHATELADPVYKITIIPRGQAGGYTWSLPEGDRILISRSKMLARITGLLGGRAAEEIFFQDITNGASNDLKVATQMAEEMVMRLGMDTRAGLRVFAAHDGLPFGESGSQKTRETIDEAVRNILECCYEDARRILTEKRAEIERVANRLLEVETLDREAFVELMEGE